MISIVCQVSGRVSEGGICCSPNQQDTLLYEETLLYICFKNHLAFNISNQMCSLKSADLTPDPYLTQTRVNLTQRYLVTTQKVCDWYQGQYFYTGLSVYFYKALLPKGLKHVININSSVVMTASEERGHKYQFRWEKLGDGSEENETTLQRARQWGVTEPSVPALLSLR